MPPEPEKKAAATDEAPEALTEERVAAMVNAAITGHLKRFAGTVEKTVAESVGKALAAAPKPEADERPAAESGRGRAAADPETKLLREKIEKLEAATAAAEQRAKTTEEKARRDATRGQVREQLEALGVKGARARAVLHDMEATGALRFDEETGAPQLVVKRSRSKGAAPAELAFEDLAAGVRDWSQTPEAAEFIPAPSAGAAAPRARPAGAPPVVRKGDDGKPAENFEDGVAGLSSALERGAVDLSALID